MDGITVGIQDIRATDTDGTPLEDANGAPIIDENATAFEEFSTADMADISFSEDADAVGSSWRSVFPPPYHYDYIYYIIKDAEGNQYKLRFTKFANEMSEAGYPEIEYILIQ